MKYTKTLQWINPYENIWGFHIHQELPYKEFHRALVIQQHCHDFLRKHHVSINDTDSMKPGYGPHLDYIWDLRVEKDPEETMQKLGLAISYMAINRFNLSAYIHPLRQDKKRKDDFDTEGRLNQGNILWFGYKVPHYQDFFFQPPRDKNNQIKDTRTSRIIAEGEKKDLLTLGKKSLKTSDFKDPFEAIVNGYHIHLDYSDDQKTVALEVLEHFISFLFTEGIHPSNIRIYEPIVNGPHLQQGWEVKFLTQDPSIIRNIGIATAWLMCNRQGLPIFIHPVTWHDGDIKEELRAHQDYAMFMDEMPELDLSFFSKKIERMQATCS